MSSAVQSAKSLIEQAQGLLAEAAALAAGHTARGDGKVRENPDKSRLSESGHEEGRQDGEQGRPDALGALVEDFADVKRRLDSVDAGRVADLLVRISATVTELNALRERIALIRRSRRVLGGGF